MSLEPGAIEAAFLAACRAELDAVKPGNVHRFAPGHGMEAATFEAAAAAAAPFVAQPGAGVGARILGATQASWTSVGVNANLGILLLAAPLAAAAETASGRGVEALRAALAQVLAKLTAKDAADAFAAIALASPGGLGEAAEHDVRQPPSIGLVAAMRLASGRDLVARQYADGFADIFDIGLPALRASEGAPAAPGLGPALDAYLAFASCFPDSHVARKYGEPCAEALRLRMADFTHGLGLITEPADALSAALAFDAQLKREKLNPGTSADLTVASLFARFLAEAWWE
ncbi:triphosphoribosyl-dephospho-CoA synthase [Aurantimonas aggregata]|uniref:Triphosphoribosyl-dephospho-CoA synthase n=1 Tax=Aurantimonas aggregata TaxID=2047720 RepID=A0A6L9MHD8_9HYPH|nr:triphosphoribosyl-dephospho-CoA synthase [Aurantimonas aggregata]NDV87273.1 triphosphoribosyl-dephospho-CoA synthase [Aurantimonas aggregata]